MDIKNNKNKCVGIYILPFLYRFNTSLFTQVFNEALM